MAPMSETERQKILLQQEIAKLSGAISRHATSHHPTFHPYRPPHGSSSRGKPPRGRGRGGSFALDLRAANRLAQTTATGTATASSAGNSAGPSAGSSRVASPFVLPDPAGKEEREAGEVTPSPPGSVSGKEKGKGTEKAVVPRSQSSASWVKGTSKGGNMSLMTVEKSKHLKSLPPKPRIRKQRIPPSIQVLNSTSTPQGSQRVVIDGIIFQFEPGGTKLTRIGELEGTKAVAQGTPTRKKLDFGGKQYRRTSRGNLVTSASREELAKKPCRYYTKTGRCNRALTCPFAHDPNRLAICPRFLRSTCPHDAASCPLSHEPSPHNTPSCVHFQASSSCRNGAKCPYPHVKVAEDAPVCDSFARDGWCDQEEGRCPKLHVWECGEWRETGKCSRKGKCGLRHVLRAEKGKGKGKGIGSQQEAKKEGMDMDEVLVDDGDRSRGVKVPVEGAPGAVGGFEEQSEYIGFTEQGSPGEITEEEEEEGDEEAEGGSESGSGSESEDDTRSDNGYADGEGDAANFGKPLEEPFPTSTSDFDMRTDEEDDEDGDGEGSEGEDDDDNDEADEETVLGVVS